MDDATPGDQTDMVWQLVRVDGHLSADTFTKAVADGLDAIRTQAGARGLVVLDYHTELIGSNDGAEVIVTAEVAPADI